MADEEDGAKENAGGGAKGGVSNAKNKTPWLLIGIIIFLVAILVAGATVGALYYAGLFESKQQKETAAGKKSKGKDGGDEDVETEEGGEGEQKKTAIYVPIESTFVVNFEGVSKVRFLQLTVELMTRDETAVESLNTHMPVIRNNLTLLFSSYTFKDVNTVEGKQQLRASALAEVQKIMAEETGSPVVDALYFTSFVTQ